MEAVPKQRFYHGTRAELRAGDLVQRDQNQSHVRLTPDLDAAIWEGELAPGEGPGRVYRVEPVGPIEDASSVAGEKSPGHPWMAWRSQDALRVTGEITEWPLYHGTRADLKAGDLIKPGHTPNFGKREIATTFVYFTRTLDAATWGAELAEGEGRGRIYVVTPTGPVEEDPNLTNAKFRGNPTKSFRSRDPLRIVAEVAEWQGHPPALLKAMKEGVARAKAQGIEPL